jgi:tetratricopeptide (TPR) repeat protein
MGRNLMKLARGYYPKDNAKSVYFLGRNYHHQKLYQDAIKAFEEVLEIEPNYHRAWYDIGNTYEKLGEFNKAIECYQKALNNDPNDVYAWYNMGRAYKEIGDLIRANECFQEAERLSISMGIIVSREKDRGVLL